MKQKPKTTDAPPVLQMAEATAMSQDERIAGFKTRDQSCSRLTVELGKLLVAMRAAMRDPSQATAILKKQGIRPGSVNTASETARVFNELVLGKKQFLDEAVFDTFTAADIRVINQCMSGRSAKKLTAAEVAALVTSKPKSYDEELQSYYDHGMPVAEHKAAEKADADAKAAQEKSDAAELKAAKKKLPASGSDATPQTSEQAPNVVPSGIVNTNADQTNGRTDVTNLTTSGEPAKPKTENDKTLHALHLIDELELALADLTIERGRKVAPVMLALYERFMERISSTPEEQKTVAKKLSKKAA